jgi:hypothetical protein
MYDEDFSVLEYQDSVAELTLSSSHAFEAAISGCTADSVDRYKRQRLRKQDLAVSDFLSTISDVRLELARTAADRAEADRLVDRQYSARGLGTYAPPHASESRGPRRRSRIILAYLNGKAVGTVTIGIDSPAGPMADDVYGDQVAPLRARRRRLGEVVRLAVTECEDSRRILAALFNAAHGIMVSHRLDDVFVEVNPRHVGFYKRALCFQVAGAERVCPRVGAPSILLKMTVNDLTSKIGSLSRAIAEFPIS